MTPPDDKRDRLKSLEDCIKVSLAAVPGEPTPPCGGQPHTQPMKTAPRRSAAWRMLRLVFPSLATGLLLLLNPSAASARDFSVSELTTVFSTVHNGYQREKLPDGSFKTVRYAFGEGTCDPGSVADLSLNRLKFPQLAVLLSAPLAKLGYQPTNNAKDIDQLIVVHWGRSIGWDGSRGNGGGYANLSESYSAMKRTFPNSGSLPGNFGAGQSSPRTRGVGGELGAGSEMDYMMTMIHFQEEARARSNYRNARLLGYYDALKHTPLYYGNLVSPRRERLIGDLEDDRYYVIVAAYDFQATRKSRHPKVLWITRFSLQSYGNEFDQSIDRMVPAASAYFGRSSDGLHYERPAEAVVVPGELKLLEYLERSK